MGESGWFVVNASDARWLDNDAFGAYTRFEGEGARFEQVGINISVLQPGQPMALYHGEEDQEDFLVLSGTAVLVVEGQERPLEQWDFVHCPPWTEHVIVGAGERQCGGELRVPACERDVGAPLFFFASQGACEVGVLVMPAGLAPAPISRNPSS